MKEKLQTRVPIPAGSRRASRWQSRLGHRPGRGFTLIEFIGVVAVIGLLAGMLIPVMIRRVDQAARTQDGTDVDSMIEALRLYILQNKVVPNDLTNAIQSKMTLPMGLITKTRRGTSRTFMIDPAITNLGVLPYTQGTGGAGKPTNARMLIASCLESNSPSGTFGTLWNTPDNDAVRIRRLNLEPLFYQLMLLNRDTGTLFPKWSIDANGNRDIVMNGVGTNAYYLDGSVVSLYTTNSALFTRHILTASISFTFESGGWRSQFLGTNNPNSTNTSGNASAVFAATAAAFLATNWNGGANNQGGQSANQGAALASMYNYMSDYTLWANTTPTNFFRYGTANGQMNSFPIYELLNRAYLNVKKYTDDGNDGLMH